MQLDWVGAPEAPPFRDIANKRPGPAEEKAILALELGRLINSIPPSIKAGGSVNLVRHWQAERATCAKVAKNSRASVNELASAINRMRQFK